MDFDDFSKEAARNAASKCTIQLVTLNKYSIHRSTEQKAYRFNQFSSVQSLSCVWLFVTPWIAARQASLFIATLGFP